MLRYGPYYQKTYVRPDGAIVQYPADQNVAYKEIMPLSVKENGELLTSESFKYCARVIHYELGLPLFHYHSLRHTHGTILAENGAYPKTVMERLGHKDITTTMNKYVFNTEKGLTKGRQYLLVTPQFPSKAAYFLYRLAIVSTCTVPGNISTQQIRSTTYPCACKTSRSRCRLVGLQEI